MTFADPLLFCGNHAVIADDAESGFSFGASGGDEGNDEASGFSFGAAPAEDAPGSDSFSFGAADVSQEPPTPATVPTPAPAPAPKPKPAPVTAVTKPKMNFKKTTTKKRKKKKKSGIGMFGRSTPASPEPEPEPAPEPAPAPAPEPAPAATSNPPVPKRGAPPARPPPRNRSAPPPKPAPALPPARKPKPAPAPAPIEPETHVEDDDFAADIEPETHVEDDDFAADIDDLDSNAVGMFGGMELHSETTTEPQDDDDGGMFGGMDEGFQDTGAEETADALAGLQSTDGAADDLHGLGEVDYTATKHDKLQQIISKLGHDCQGVGGKLQGCRDQRAALVQQRHAKVERTAALKLEIKQKESAIAEVVLHAVHTPMQRVGYMDTYTHVITYLAALAHFAREHIFSSCFLPPPPHAHATRMHHAHPPQACARDDYALAEELENALKGLKGRVSEMEAESESLGTQVGPAINCWGGTFLCITPTLGP